MADYFDFRGKIVAPKLIWIDGKFLLNQKVRIGLNGEILEIGKDVVGDSVIWLPNEAFIPGFINAHSHAFHRYLRGHTGIGHKEADSFWKWRDAMYSLVENTDYDKFKEVWLPKYIKIMRINFSFVREPSKRCWVLELPRSGSSTTSTMVLISSNWIKLSSKQLKKSGSDLF